MSLRRRIIFYGTPEIATPLLRALAGDGRFEIALVVSQPDRPKGRDLKLSPTPVKTVALELGLEVAQPRRARDEDFIRVVEGLRAEVGVVMAFGQILPQALLDATRAGHVNIHTSLLPKYRGAAPIQWAILNGDVETGVTLMKMEAGLDTGPILAVERTPIRMEDDARALHDRLALLGAKLALDSLEGYLDGAIQPIPQPAGATHARKITREDGQLDWRESAQQLDRRIRGLTPWPGTFTFLTMGGKTKLLKIWKASPLASKLPLPGGTIAQANETDFIVACGAGSLRIETVQLEGGRRMESAEFLKGHPLTPGEVLGGKQANPA